MSSYRELFDDYKAATLNYTEKLVITEPEFMRKLTSASQQFQRDTKLQERVQVLTRAKDAISGAYYNYFDAPTDFLEVIEVYDSHGITLLQQEYTQFKRNTMLYHNMHTNTPTSFADRLNPVERINTYYPNLPLMHFNRELEHGIQKGRLFSIINNQVYVYPDIITELEITIAYYPDLETFSEISPQWTNWFPETNFMQNFHTQDLGQDLRKWEKAILNLAISETVKQSGSANYKIYENIYLGEVKKCIDNKPNMFREGSRDYHYATHQ